MTKTVVGVVLTLLTGWGVLAAPNISSVSGKIGAHQIITITGAGLGDGPEVAFFDDFEKGHDGRELGDLDGDGITDPGNARIGWWINGAARKGHVIYSSRHALSGCLSEYSDFWKDDSAAAFFFPPATDVFWMYWLYIPADRGWPGTAGGAANFKVTWITQSDWSTDLTLPTATYYSGDDPGQWRAGGNHCACNGVCRATASPLNDAPDSSTAATSPSQWGYSGGDLGFAWTGENHLACLDDCPGAACEPGYAPDLVKGRWYRAWFWINNTGGALESWELSQTGPVRRAKHAHSPLCSGRHYDRMFVPGWSNSGDNPDTDVAHYDDVYLATGPHAQARVEIGNAPYYGECTNLTLCVVADWNATTIHCEIAKGAFQDRDLAYVFVIDSRGAASEGYPVKFRREAVPVCFSAGP